MKQTKRYIDTCTWAMRRYSSRKGNFKGGKHWTRLHRIEELAFQRYIQQVKKNVVTSDDGLQRSLRCCGLNFKKTKKTTELTGEPIDLRILPFHRQVTLGRRFYGWTVAGPLFHRKHWTIDGEAKFSRRIVVACCCADKTPTVISQRDMETGYFKDCGCGEGERLNEDGEWAGYLGGR